MRIPIKEELVEICKAIIAEDRNLEQWAEIESDDMYQTSQFVGGFEAAESEFCFSYYDDDGFEYWFQFSLADAESIADEEIVILEGRPA